MDEWMDGWIDVEMDRLRGEWMIDGKTLGIDLSLRQVESKIGKVAWKKSQLVVRSMYSLASIHLYKLERLVRLIPRKVPTV